MEEVLKELVKLVKRQPSAGKMLYRSLSSLVFITKRGRGTLTENGNLRIGSQVVNVGRILGIQTEGFGIEHLPKDFLADEELLKMEDEDGTEHEEI